MLGTNAFVAVLCFAGVLGVNHIRAAASLAETTAPEHARLRHLTEAGLASDAASAWTIVCDAGSTGTRLYAYSFDPLTNAPVAKEGIKVKPGLSTLAATPEKAAAYLLPIFTDALRLVPSAQRAATRVMILATAGMRLVPAEQQEALFDAIHLGLDVPFAVARGDLRTISGSDEGYFGALAVNALEGAASPALAHLGPLIGALDLGGSSTQISVPRARERMTSTPASGRISADEFYVHSDLSYGATIAQGLVRSKAAAGAKGQASASFACMFAGAEAETDGVKLLGSGDASACRAQIAAQLFPPGGQFAKEHSASEQPSVRGKRFVAMSKYFYAADALQKLSPPSPVSAAWPRPSVGELQTAADAWCATEWSVLRHKTHEHSPPDVLPWRCFDINYALVLLQEGYGFEADSRVKFALALNGTDVEWTLGAFLAADALVRSDPPSLAPSRPDLPFWKREGASAVLEDARSLSPGGASSVVEGPAEVPFHIQILHKLMSHIRALWDTTVAPAV